MLLGGLNSLICHYFKETLPATCLHGVECAFFNSKGFGEEFYKSIFILVFSKDLRGGCCPLFVRRELGEPARVLWGG